MFSNKNINKIIMEMSIDEKAGQLIASGFTGTDELTPTITHALENGHIGTIMYHCAKNVRNAFQIKELSVNIQNAAVKSPLKTPSFIAVDQEGGQLAVIFRDVNIHPGNMALSAICKDEEKYCYKAGMHTAIELKTLGININLAPVIDLALDEGLPVKDNRYFGSVPEKAGMLGSAMIKGLQDQGVIACAKHFPGQRNVNLDSHYKLDIIDTPKETLLKRELIPFKMAVKNGVEMVMSIHAAYSALEPDPNLPATLSHTILTGLLREEFEFDGIIITDDIQMKPIADVYGLDNAIIKSLKAGVDIILTSDEQYDAYKIIVDAVKINVLSEEIINKSVYRILKAKQKYISLDWDDKDTSYSILNNADAKIFVQEAARKSITLHKNTKIKYPLQIKENEHFTIIRTPFVRLVMSDNMNLNEYSFKDIFTVYTPNVSEYVYGIQPVENEILSISDHALMSDYILYCTYNAYQYKNQLKALREIFEFINPDRIIVVALRSPTDIRIIPKEINSIWLTYGVTKPSIEALAKCIFGGLKPEGKLPVNVDNYKL